MLGSKIVIISMTSISNTMDYSVDESGTQSKRIVFTGGSGVAGRHVIEKLLTFGHEILNIDVVPLNNPNVHTMKADLTDGAQAFNSLSCHFKLTEPFEDGLVGQYLKTPDAVIHFAGKTKYTITWTVPLILKKCSCI